jgi:hypothetical protein
MEVDIKINCLSCNAINFLEKNIYDYDEMVFCHHCHNLLNDI